MELFYSALKYLLGLSFAIPGKPSYISFTNSLALQRKMITFLLTIESHYNNKLMVFPKVCLHPKVIIDLVLANIGI